jgi:hypothetical protein
MIGIEQILDSGLKVSVVGKRLSVQGPANLVAQYRPALEKFGRDLVDLKTSELTDGVGSCPGCQLNLIGLRTFDGYVNRFCPVCGGWQICKKAKEAKCETK